MVSVSSFRRGFTLVELTLAIVVGSMVLLGVAGVFAATRNMDRIFGAQYESSTQLHITQLTIRKSLLALQIKEDSRPNPSSQDGISDVSDEESRSRIILETDPVYAEIPGPWQPQRFELVVSTPPIALNMATQAAAWARINDRDSQSLNFSSVDASGGVMRSVFELRPDGARERVLRQVGILDPDSKADEQSLINEAVPNGWTLWWRPILFTEGNYLKNGGSPLPDIAGTDDQIRFRLAGAIPLVKNIDVCGWTVYKGDEKVTDYQALSMSDLPAYAEFDVLLLNGQYATWMFEVDWVLGDDPLELGEEDGGPGSGDDSDPDDSPNPGDPSSPADPSNPDDRGPRGPIMPGQNSNNNMGGGDT